jgi:hypothetical protein
MADAEKKGMSPLAWILVGCGGLVLIGGIAFGIFLFWAGKKVKTLAEEAEKDPGLLLAKTIGATNPEIEFVGREGEMYTFRNEKTGEEISISLDDLKQGKISVTSAEGTSELTFSEENGQAEFKMETPDGSYTSSGGGDLSQLPEWLSLPEGAEVMSHIHQNTSTQTGGMLTLKLAGDLDSSAAYYRQSMAGQGFELAESSFSSGDNHTLHLQGKNEALRRSLNVTLSSGDSVQANLIYSEEH